MTRRAAAQDAFHGRETKLGPQHADTIELLNELASLDESWSSTRQAARWRVKLPMEAP